MVAQSPFRWRFRASDDRGHRGIGAKDGGGTRLLALQEVIPHGREKRAAVRLLVDLRQRWAAAHERRPFPLDVELEVWAFLDDRIGLARRGLRLRLYPCIGIYLAASAAHCDPALPSGAGLVPTDIGHRAVLGRLPG